MANQRWTLLIVPDTQEGVRQFRVSRNTVRLGFGALLIALSVLTTFTAGFFVKESESLRASRLQEENARLVGELDRINDRLGSLKVAMQDLSERDERFRLVAGLEPLDADVRMAGIGGPGTETLQANPVYELNAEAGEAAFAASMDVEGLLRRATVLAASWTEATDSVSVKHALLRSTPSILPTSGFITSGFSRSRMHPILNRARPHEGVDVVAPRGTPVRSAANGVISFAGRRGGYGIVVEVDHGYGYKTRYAHLSRATVQRGQAVTRGDEIGKVGTTGLSTAPHLHYEILVNGRPQDPAYYILDREVVPD